MPATFTDHDAKAGLKNRKKLSVFLDGLVQQQLEGVKKVKLSYIFCSDDFLHSMNVKYLDHDTLTDIITFDLGDESNMAGEIYISTDRVKDNAAKFGVTYELELHRVIFHGALHLCGFKDKTKKDKAEMRLQEDRCLETYFQQ